MDQAEQLRNIIKKENTPQRPKAHYNTSCEKAECKSQMSAD